MNCVPSTGAAPHDTDVLVLVGSVSDVECGILRHLRSWPHKITMNILKCSLVAGSFSVLEVSGADDMTFTVSCDGVLDGSTKRLHLWKAIGPHLIATP